MQPRAPRWRRYLRFWRVDVRADVADEFQFHLQERVDDLVARGADPRVAREDAWRRFGDIEQLRTTCETLAEAREHDMRRAETFTVIKQDAMYAIRLMRTHPSITAAITLTLAVGIGATTAIFSVVNAVLLRPLPFADSDRIVMVQEWFRNNGGRASAGHFHDWTEQTRVLEATAAWTQRNFALTDGEPTRLFGARVTPSFFQVQYVRPALGRYFLPTETAESHVVVISHPLWQARFSGDPAIVGKTMTLDGAAYTIVGVTPAAFTMTRFDERLWTPFAFAPGQRTNYGSHSLTVFAKLKPGVSVQSAQRDLERVTEDIRRRQPENMKDRGVRVSSLRDMLIGDYRTQLLVLLGAVVFVLLIGCANVASLLLARAMSRRKEIAIRAALGGARGRLIGQLLTESFLLALGGGVIGVFVATLGVRMLVNLGPSWVPRLGEAGLQLDVLAFAAVSTIVCGLLFGVAPALRATRLDLQSELRDPGRGSRAAIRDRARSTLLVTEVAVALVLMVSASLFIRSAIQLSAVGIGFEPSGVTMTRVALPADRYDSAGTVQSAFLRIVERARAIPGAENAAASTRVPMWGVSIDMGVKIDGRASDPNRLDVAHTRLVTPGFFETLGIPLKRGRRLTERDVVAGAPWVVVVNEMFARSVFGDANPIGHRISGWTNGPEPEWREIVGVVGDVRAFGRENDIPPEVFIPLTQAPTGAWNAFQRAMAVVVKAKPGLTVAPGLRAAVRDVDPLVPLYDLQTMDDVLSQSIAGRRFNTLLLSLLGITGLVLATIGIYGVMAFFVGQRTHEIGIRIALGASRSSVVRLVVRQAVLLTGIGIILGAVLSYWATSVLGTMLFRIGARDPISFMAGAGVLLVVALAASWSPARRAAHVDPVRALASAG